MGFYPKGQSESSVTYISIRNGHFVQSVSSDTPNAIPRINKKGVTVYELLFNSDFGGKLYDAKLKKNTFDGSDEIVMKFVDSDNLRWILQFSLRSAYGRRFLSVFPSIETNIDVFISPFYFLPKGQEKYVSGMNIYQNGRKLEPFYANDDLNGVPELKKIIFRGEETIDDTERVQYLKDMFNDWRAKNFPEQVQRDIDYAEGNAVGSNPTTNHPVVPQVAYTQNNPYTKTQPTVGGADDDGGLPF